MLPHQQTKQSGFPSTVAPSKPEPPVDISFKRDVVEHRLDPAVVGKAKMTDTDQRHSLHPL